MLLTGFKVVMRTLNFWSQFEGFTGKMKLMFGGSKVLEEIPLTQGKAGFMLKLQLWTYMLTPY